MTLPLQQNLIGRPYAPAECVVDPESIAQVQHALMSVSAADLDASTVKEFCNTYRGWISSTKINSVIGLDQFPVAAVSQGTTQAFDNFYVKHHSKRFRCWRGEYIYHQRVWQQHYPNQWAFLDDAPLEHNDAVIVSWPFADTGNRHSGFDKDFLDQCYQLQIPVLLDLAFFGVCGNQQFDFDHPAVTDLVFSLSKTFPVNHLRIGIRFTRQNHEDGMQIYHSTEYVNKFTCAVGTKLMLQQHPDQQFQRWRSGQIKFCELLGLAVSDTVLFGLDTKHRYDHYNRGSVHTNRLCFSRYFVTGSLVKDVVNY